LQFGTTHWVIKERVLVIGFYVVFATVLASELFQRLFSRAFDGRNGQQATQKASIFLIMTVG
jgi:hypothetical protein